MMDHVTIEENQVIDRYIMGTLSDEEHEQFSQHFLDCSECLEQLELSESFQKGLKTVVAQDVTKQVQSGFLTMLFRSKMLAGVGALALAVTFAMFILPGANRISSIEMSNFSRSSGSTAPLELVYENDGQEFVLTRKVALSQAERQTARFRAEILQNGTRMTAYETILPEGMIKVPVRALPEGPYMLKLELARDGQTFRPYEEYQLTISKD